MLGKCMHGIGQDNGSFWGPLYVQALGKMASRLRKGNTTGKGETRHMELRRGDMLRAEADRYGICSNERRR